MYEMNSTLQTVIANVTKQCTNHLKHNSSTSDPHAGHHTGHGSSGGGGHDVNICLFISLYFENTFLF